MRYFKIHLYRNFLWKVKEYSGSNSVWKWDLRSKIEVWHSLDYNFSKTLPINFHLLKHLQETSNTQGHYQKTSTAQYYQQMGRDYIHKENSFTKRIPPKMVIKGLIHPFQFSILDRNEPDIMTPDKLPHFLFLHPTPQTYNIR